MKILKQTALAWTMIVAAGAGGARAEAVDALGKKEATPKFLYFGFGYGPTAVGLGSQARSIEGIDFTLDANADDLGYSGYLGWWINRNVALEVGRMDFGSIDVPFTFQDPHDNTSGRGQASAAFAGSTVSLRMGADLGDAASVFARAGAISWTNNIESRFDLPGQPAIRRELSDSGVGMTLGAGFNFRLSDCWRMQLEGQHCTLGEDTVDMVTLGLAFDFGALLEQVREEF